MFNQATWECPVCGWIVSDTEYLNIIFDPDCRGCGVRKWSEYKYIPPNSSVENE